MPGDFGLPVRYLKNLGILSPRLILAHVLHLDDEEIPDPCRFGAHGPQSGFQSETGFGRSFKFDEMKKAGECRFGNRWFAHRQQSGYSWSDAARFVAREAWRRIAGSIPAGIRSKDCHYSGAKMLLRLNAGRIERLSSRSLLVNLLTPFFFTQPNGRPVTGSIQPMEAASTPSSFGDGRCWWKTDGGRRGGDSQTCRTICMNLINR